MMRMQRLPLALLVVLVWGIVTVVGGRLMSGGEGDLTKLVTEGIAWQLVAALAILMVAIILFGWRDMGLKAPVRGWAATIWFSLLYLVLLAGVGLAAGWPKASIVFFVFLNTLVVGFSEELAFRGVLFRGLLTRMNVVPAIILTSALFGAVHVLNGLVTGQFVLAAVQAVAAFLTGIALMAIMIRSGSIMVAILYHALWDFCTFLIGISAGTADGAANDAATQTTISPLMLLVPALFVLPNALFGIYLLRNVRKMPEFAGGPTMQPV